MPESQRTFAIIKPDAVAKQVAGQIIARIEESGLELLAIKRLQLDDRLAQGFYAVHKERPFFGDLVKFMTSGPVIAMVLEGEEAIQRWRDLMGPTNSNEAPAGTLRGDFGTDIERNAVHGSDAPETAKLEISYFFNAGEIQALVEALP
ncbi:MAG: nucleoside-diphosphate kinase [Deltaproteobacteria bacterium]|jgi:nucleoside-diphosphate kinase|nr:nucleoside-diphosphate kinase [Deltaproteobacteria bacterium]MBW2382127.1 nucleoside-diphosphate kinase [Deltaproteobacteria bacterium]